MRILRSLLAAFVLLVWCYSACFGAKRKSYLVFFQIADPQMGMFSKNNGSEQEIRNLDQVVGLANRLHPAFVVVCGDLVNSAQNTEELQAFDKSIAALHNVPLHLVAGNHDVGNHPDIRRLEYYRDQHGPDFYTFTSGRLTGIVLDSQLMEDANAPDESARQLAWLEQTLRSLQRGESQPGHITAVFQHIPFFVHTEDEPDSYWNIPTAARRRYLDLLRQFHVKYVFAGHLHYPTYAEGDDLQVFVTGATGKPLGKSVSGFNLVNIDRAGKVDVRYISLAASSEGMVPEP
jgi:3',5'-cyclic AMP phosphodiesterase CpdA